LRSAADLLKDIEGAERTRGRLLYRYSRLQRFSDLAGAIAAVDEAEGLAAQIDDEVLAAEVFFHRGILLCYSDRFRSGLAEMTIGIEALEAMPLEATREFSVTEPWLADALSVTTPVHTTADDAAISLLHAAGLHYRRGTQPFLLAGGGRIQQAIAIAEQFIAVLAEAPTPTKGIGSITAFSYMGLGVANAALGQSNEARDAFKRALELFQAMDHHCLVAFTLLTALRDVAMTYVAADPHLRHQMAAEAESALGRAGGALDPNVSPRLAGLGCLVLDGQWKDALTVLRELPLPGNAYLRREVTTARVVLGRHRGEPEIAWQEIFGLFLDGAATEPGDLIHQEGLFLQRLAADLCLDAGDLPGAHAWLAAHDNWLAWSDSVLGRADGALTWARFHQVSGENTLASSAAATALALATAPDQPFTQLAAHRLLGQIDTATGDFIEGERHLTAALDLADTCEAPFERALTLLAIAELRAAQGHTSEAAALLDDVRHLCTPLEAAPTLARAASLAARLSTVPPGESYPAGLTEREVEVLRLLARRQTDKEIAEVLFLGPRTVQSHVAHILNKLGVANRREAATRADGLGLL
jgi:DNA-binding CsgD family transcriptional regulator